MEISTSKTKARAINSGFFILIGHEIHLLKGSLYFPCLAMKTKENESTVSL